MTKGVIVLLFVLLPPDTVVEGIMFLGCRGAFFQTDIVTMMSDELLEHVEAISASVLSGVAMLS